MYDLIHGNCIDVLRQMPDKSVDCIITDPPYGVGIEYDNYQDTAENLEVLIAHGLPEMRRVARSRVAVVAAIRNIALYPQPSWVLAWFFPGNGCCPWGFNSWTPIFVYGRDPDVRLRMRRTDVIRGTHVATGDKNQHPTPKPLSFMRKLVNRVAPSPSNTILDPFMGSGTTGVAAIQLGHNFIGIEINGDYLAIAKRRIAATRPDFHLTVDLKAKDIPCSTSQT
jgi:site-specific DNA-methyltransferase (adenine-specific)